MKYTLTYSATNAKYACHAAGCSAARGNEERGIHGPIGSFTTVAEARAWADADESEKAEEPVKANWKRCPCTKENTK